MPCPSPPGLGRPTGEGSPEGRAGSARLARRRRREEPSLSIFAAELNRKTSEEDFLVSRFFGTLAVADRARVLGPILAEVGVETARSELAKIRIEFWQRYFRATPSVLLEGESSLVFFEAPHDLEAEGADLLAECEEGLKGNSLFTLALVTRHASEPPGVAALRSELAARRKSGRIVWTSWHRLYKRVHALASSPDIDEVSRRLLGDLLRLLEDKGLRGFVGFDAEAYERVGRAAADLAAFGRTTQILVSEVTAALDRIGIYPLHLGPGGSPDADGLRVPGHLRHAFREESWDGPEVARCHYFLNVFLTEPLLWAGFRIDVTEPGRRALVVEKRAALAAAIEERPGAAVAFLSGEEIGDVERAVRAGEGGLGFLEGRDALRRITHVDLVVPVSDGELASEALAALLVERFEWLRAKVTTLGLYAVGEGESDRRFVVTNQ